MGSNGKRRTARITVGPWRIIHELGEGGMARVFLAEREYGSGQTKIGVVKIPKDRFLAEEHHRDAFIAEADTAMRLDHPNIVPVFDAGVDEGLPYFAMMFVAGQSLSHVIRDRQSRSIACEPELAAYVTLQVAYGLQYAHEFEVAGVPQKIIHRDMAAKNAMIGGDGSVRLSDFGVASVVSRETSGHSVKGTILYMAPEHALGHASQSSDVFGLGTILWMLLAGGRFRGDVDRKKLMTAAIKGYIPRLPRRDAPAALLTVLDGFLDPNEASRMPLAEAIPILEQFPSTRSALSRLMKRLYGKAARRSGRTRPDHPVIKNAVLTKALARTRQRLEQVEAPAADDTAEVPIPAALRADAPPVPARAEPTPEPVTERYGDATARAPVPATEWLEPLAGSTPAAALEPTHQPSDAVTRTNLGEHETPLPLTHAQAGGVPRKRSPSTWSAVWPWLVLGVVSTSLGVGGMLVYHFATREVGEARVSAVETELARSNADEAVPEAPPKLEPARTDPPVGIPQTPETPPASEILAGAATPGDPEGSATSAPPASADPPPASAPPEVDPLPASPSDRSAPTPGRAAASADATPSPPVSDAGRPAARPRRGESRGRSGKAEAVRSVVMRVGLGFVEAAEIRIDGDTHRLGASKSKTTIKLRSGEHTFRWSSGGGAWHSAKWTLRDGCEYFALVDEKATKLSKKGCKGGGAP